MTIRILFIARCRDDVINRKVELLACQADLSVCHVGPRHWREEYAQSKQSAVAGKGQQRLVVPTIGRVSDPHRVLYRSVRFGMERFRPHIIYAEEEPDSLAALQIALARRIVYPRAKLALFSWQNVNRPKRWYVRWVLQMTLRASDAMLCANQTGPSVLRQQGYMGPVEILPAYGVDMQLFKPCHSLASDRQSFVVGYVGRLSPEKGIDLLISAFSQLCQGIGSGTRPRKSVELRIVGDGPERRRLGEQVQQEGLTNHVRFVGAVSPLETAKHMCQMDALILPSRSTPVWQEQFGRVLVEAMACKVPVIGADSGAIPEVIGDTGLVFPEDDTVALTARLRQLIESPTMWHDFAERGYDRVRTFYSQERIAERTADFFRRMSASVQ